jgi:hypothetical protein
VILLFEENFSGATLTIPEPSGINKPDKKAKDNNTIEVHFHHCFFRKLNIAMH